MLKPPSKYTTHCMASVKWRTGKSFATHCTTGDMALSGKVSPESVAPSEPTIETTLMTSDNTGNKAYKMTATDCVAMMKSTVIRKKSHILPAKGICSKWKNTTPASRASAMKISV